MNYVIMRHRGHPRFFLLLVIVLLYSCLQSCLCHEALKEDTDSYLSRVAADLWLEGGDVVKIIWRDCSKKLVDVKDVIDHKEYFPKFVRCMKRKTLRALDRSLTPDVVPITDGVNLVRFEMVDRSGNVMSDNKTSTWSEQEMDEGDWRTLALQRMAKVLRTHVIKFDFDESKSAAKVESRGRRRHMMTMMMFGIVSIGMVVIPMGFQFLAVLGGKALLLAKMALILASIQGLKKVDVGYDGYHDKGKIAASPVNYGFYHSFPPPYEHFEQRSSDNWPALSSIPATSPPATSMDSWPQIDTPFKIDRMHQASETEDPVTWKPEIPKALKLEPEPRVYPVYPGFQDPTYTTIDQPNLVDFTTKPGEVQADFAINLPYNGFRYQSPTPVISA